MSVVDFILVGYAIVLTFGGIVHFFVGRTQLEQVRNDVVMNKQFLQILKDTPSNNDLSAELVELHRKLMQLQTVSENQELRLTDIADTLEHRFHRLRMRQQRARQEGEDEEPEVDPEAQLQLLQEMGAAAPVADEQPVQRRGRLVAKHNRSKYRR